LVSFLPFTLRFLSPQNARACERKKNSQPGERGPKKVSHGSHRRLPTLNDFNMVRGPRGNIIGRRTQIFVSSAARCPLPSRLHVPTCYSQGWSLPMPGVCSLIRFLRREKKCDIDRVRPVSQRTSPLSDTQRSSEVWPRSYVSLQRGSRTRGRHYFVQNDINTPHRGRSHKRLHIDPINSIVFDIIAVL